MPDVMLALHASTHQAQQSKRWYNQISNLHENMNLYLAFKSAVVTGAHAGVLAQCTSTARMSCSVTKLCLLSPCISKACTFRGPPSVHKRRIVIDLDV